MPASERQNGGRGNIPHSALFWTGIGLAPLAALLVLFSSSTTALRAAAFLAILAVLLIGLSTTVRPDSANVRAEIEESLFGEFERLRANVTGATRATHNVLSDRLSSVQNQVEALRGQVDNARGQLEAMRKGYEPPAAGVASGSQPARGAAVLAPPRPVGTAMVGGGGVVRHTETVKVTTRQTIVGPQGGDERRGMYGGSGYGAGFQAEAAESPGGRRAERHGRPERAERAERAERPERVERVERPERAERVERPEPVERPARSDRGQHQEESWTEQRLRDRLRDTGSHLFGDPGRFSATATGGTGGTGFGSGGGAGFESGSGGGFGSGSRSVGSGEGGHREPERDAGWTGSGTDGGRADTYDPYAADGYGRRASSHRRDDALTGPSWNGFAPRSGIPLDDRGTAWRSEDSGEWAAESTDAPQWSDGRQWSDTPQWSDAPQWSEEVQAGDRWAEMRAGERSREMRMGERRSAMRSDEAGTRMRIEDRWAAVRRAEGLDGPGPSWDDPPARGQAAFRGSHARPDTGNFEERGGTFGERDDFGDRGTFGERGTFGDRGDFGDRGTFGEPADFGGRGETRRERREREERWSAGEAGDRWSGPSGRRERHTGTQPALPASPSDDYGAAWTRNWREEPRGGHRDWDERWEREEIPRPVSARPVSARPYVNFEATDDRWRR